MTVPIRHAATVVLLRDRPGGGGLEVFMLKRNDDSVFVPGAHLFPGGAVDDDDRDNRVAARSDLSPARARAVLGDDWALAAWVGAVRETYEEAGVLLARHADGRPIDWTDPAVADRFAVHRADVDLGRRQFVEILEEEDLVLDAHAMVPFARWVTPEGAPRRYDTWFFVTPVPDHVTAEHDDVEAVDSDWVAPADALAHHRAGRWSMIEPTLRTLDLFARFSSTNESIGALKAAASVVDGPLALVDDHGGQRVALAGER